MSARGPVGHWSLPQYPRMTSRPPRPPRLREWPTATVMRNGDMVVCENGRIGLLTELRVMLDSTVQFGADGPIGHYHYRALRRATMDEILAAGLEGVGCNQAHEPIT